MTIGLSGFGLVPLSECLTEWLGDANAPHVRAGWAGRAKALEAEVERLRARVVYLQTHASEREAALEDAVDELRGLASATDYEVEPLQLHIAQVLDRLPRSGP